MFIFFCLRLFFHSFSSYHHFPSLFFFLSPCFSLTMSQSVLDHDDPALDSDDPPMDFNDLEDDVGPAMPPPSAPLPPDSVARLSHDELRCNPEFMKYVNLVDALLLTVRSNTLSPNGELFIFPIHTSCAHSLITYSPCLTPTFELAPTAKLLGIVASCLRLVQRGTITALSPALGPSLPVPSLDSLDPPKLQG